MDNFDNDKISSGDEDIEKPIPFDDGMGDVETSSPPLNLDNSSTVDTPQVERPKPTTRKATDKMVSSERITGVKTFFTKLHVGSIAFLDEQITNWLKENPGVAIKRTNTATGVVEGKKTEPHIIVTVWY